jgi:hypothetical protein
MELWLYSHSANKLTKPPHRSSASAKDLLTLPQRHRDAGFGRANLPRRGRV